MKKKKLKIKIKKLKKKLYVIQDQIVIEKVEKEIEI